MVTLMRMLSLEVRKTEYMIPQTLSTDGEHLEPLLWEQTSITKDSLKICVF